MIIVPYDDLKRLEKRHGPAVWQMGSWNSDGVFSYSSIPMAAVMMAAVNADDPSFMEAVIHLEKSPEQAGGFIELLQSLDRKLIENIGAAYREWSFDGCTRFRGASSTVGACANSGL